MQEKEKFYIDKFDSEYLVLKQACKIWKKPGYSSLSKRLPEIGYKTAVEKGIIPKYKHIGGAYLFKIKDILEFLDNKETQDGEY